MVSFMDGFNTAKGDIRWEKRDLESSSASTRGFVKLWWNYLGNKKTAKLVTGSSKDFVNWIIDVSNGLIQLYMSVMVTGQKMLLNYL